VMPAPGARPTPQGRGPDTGTVSGTLIGFDYGERRIGYAVGETATGIANPLGAIDAAANEARWRAIDKLVDEWKPVAFVVGEPHHADGSAHAVAKLAAKFARRLLARYRLPVVMVDETLTSAIAEQSLRESRARRKPRERENADIDAVAASLILQSFLDDPGAHSHAAA
jgi:putative Holliday junction resolvase